MSVLDSRPTYKQLIDDIRLDEHEPKLAVVADELFQNWILRAERDICQKLYVEDNWLLRLITSQEDYLFQDRPRITGATTTTPIVVTAAGHEVATDDRIVTRDVQGISGANGTFIATYLSANTFSIRILKDVDGIDYSTTPVKLTIPQHGFSTGISVDLVGTLSIDATYVITVVDSNNVTLDGSTATGETYGGGATVATDSIGVGTYTVGGRFWKQNEIPTHFGDIRSPMRRNWSNYVRDINIESQDTLYAIEKRDLGWRNVNYSIYDAPNIAAITREGGQRKLRVYPPAFEDANVKIHGRVVVNPHVYARDDLDMPIHLGHEYEDIFRPFVLMKAYNHIKDPKMGENHRQQYLLGIRQFTATSVSHIRMQVDVT